MGEFSNGFIKWVRGMNLSKQARTEAEKSTAETYISDGSSAMSEAPIVDQLDRFAQAIIVAFEGEAE